MVVLHFQWTGLLLRQYKWKRQYKWFVPSTTVINCPWGLAGGTPSKYLPTGRRIRQGCISPRLCNSFPSSQAKPLLAAPPAAAFSTPARPPRRKGEMINQKLEVSKVAITCDDTGNTSRQHASVAFHKATDCSTKVATIYGNGNTSCMNYEYWA